MMFSLIFTLFFILFATVSGSPFKFRRYPTPWPDPEPCAGNCSQIHDPMVIRRASDGRWFRISTSGNIAIASAPDITGPWKYEGAMLPNGPLIHVVDDQDVWAPNTILVGDTYYTYYAVSALGFQGSDIGVATSKTLEPGSWTDHGSIGIPKSSRYNLIDPDIFLDGYNNTPYFNFGSAWQGIFQTVLDDTLLKADPTASETNLIYNSTYPPGQSYPDVVEGSFMFKWNSFYYMFFSSGACCNDEAHLAAPGEEYKIMVCRSNDVSGPFIDQAGRNCLTQNGGTLILGSHGVNVYAPGGQGVLYDSSLKSPIIYYHYIKPGFSNGVATIDQFMFGFNYLDFSSGWPVLV